MKLSRIDQIALNGATGEHYKYEDTAKQVLRFLFGDDYFELNPHYSSVDSKGIMQILVENFPNDN